MKRSCSEELYTPQDGEHRDKGNILLILSFDTVQRKRQDHVFSYRSNKCVGTSERKLCRKAKAEKNRSLLGRHGPALRCSPTLGGWWGGREAALPVPGFVVLAIPRPQDGHLHSQGVSAHLTKAKSRLL